jgi:hypothetical protein
MFELIMKFIIIDLINKNEIGFWLTFSGAIISVIGIIGFKTIKERIKKHILLIILSLIIIILGIWIVYLNFQIIENKNSNQKIITSFKSYKNSNLGNEYIKKLNPQLIENVIESMKEFDKSDETKVLEPDIYYLYLYSILYDAKRRIWAVSIMAEDEWIETPEEEEFLRLNFEAANRQVRVERIFVINRSETKKITTSKNVMEQIKKRNNYLRTFIVFKEEINKNLSNSIGNGFLAIDDYYVAEDIFDGKFIRGRLFTDSRNINSYDRIFNDLRDYAIPLDTNFIKVN